MLKIRLSRGGRKALPFYRILVTNITSPRDSKFLEKIGTYNPLLAKDHENRLSLDKERAEYWLSVGAQPSEKVAKFLIDLGVKGADKYQPTYKPKEKGEGLKKKALEKLAKEKAEAAAAVETAKAEAEAAKVAAEEAKAAAAKEAKAAAAKEAEAPKEEAPAAEAVTEEVKKED